MFLGFIIFADDILLLCPSRFAANLMLKTCEEWSNKYHIEFSTDEDASKSKTKAIVVKDLGGKVKNVAELTLYGKRLPFVKSANYLGQIISEEGNMDNDIIARKAIFIRKTKETLEDLPFAHPREQIRQSKD